MCVYVCVCFRKYSTKNIGKIDGIKNDERQR